MIKLVALAFAGLSIAHAQSGGYAFVGIADWDRDRHQDIIARDASGVLWLYPGMSVRGYSQAQRVQIGNGWNGYAFAGIADWDRDGHQDIVAKDVNGALWLYPGASKRGYSPGERVEIGNGWAGYTFVGVTDWDRDGHQDIIARDTSGVLWLYPGMSTRSYSSAQRVEIGNGWAGYVFAGLTDWDRDGHQDIIARDTSGVLWLYPGMSVRGYSPADRVQIGNGWSTYVFSRLIGDWDRDGNKDILAKDASGTLWLYPGASTRGYSQAQRVQIGNGW
ncbi:FG-GAP repeat domain-containing protein [Cupriavidus necator]|uniref:FG-GAP repeat domain-containing protein n=1 Tax=Cupriavidus necator TaxID=106590 RepID=UPI0039C3B232